MRLPILLQFFATVLSDIIMAILSINGQGKLNDDVRYRLLEHREKLRKPDLTEDKDYDF